MRLASQSDQVGRNLADHPVSLVYALTDNPVYGYRGPLSSWGVESLRVGAFRAMRGAFRMEIGNDGWSWPAGDPYVLGSGNWPGCATGNPTLTIAALALWAADTIRKQFAS